jgi:seryl-tRNA synthetase
MSSLKEKAKTLGELISEVCGRDICVGCPIAKQHNCDSLGKLVKFEDVEELEQKVKNLETGRDNLLKSLHTCTQNLNSYAKESVELKQKLQQLLEDMRKIPEKRLPLNKAAWLQEISVWEHQIEELLKEV